ncbi:hypothetical protein ACS0TY_000683 [Phlomoides rotata]
MENADSNCLGLQKVRKNGGHRSWKPYEELILMGYLKEMVASANWKTENGFRPCYLQKLEEKIRISLPGTDLRAFPNINSKILAWKKHHGCIQLALGETECGFNTSTKILDCSDPAWAKVLKKDPTVAGMRYKPWHYYADWMEVFGCDRAVGAPAQDVADEAAEIEAEGVEPQVGVAEPSPSYVVPSNVVDEAEMEADSNEPNVGTSKARDASQSSSKKRTYSQSFGKKEMITALGEIFRASDDRIGEFVKIIAYEAVPAPTAPKLTCKDIFNMLDSMGQLSLDECLDAAELLSKNPQHLEMFTGFPDVARVRYVRRLLAGDFDHKGVS